MEAQLKCMEEERTMALGSDDTGLQILLERRLLIRYHDNSSRWHFTIRASYERTVGLSDRCQVEAGSELLVAVKVIESLLVDKALMQKELAPRGRLRS